MKKVMIGLFLFLVACSKDPIEPAPDPCMGVTLMIGMDTVIHWHKVCGEDLARYRSYPPEAPVSPCDNRIQRIIIEPDHCKIISE